MKASARVASVLPATQPLGTPPPACMPAGPLAARCDTTHDTNTPHLAQRNPELSLSPLLSLMVAITEHDAALPSLLVSPLFCPHRCAFYTGVLMIINYHLPPSCSASLSPLVATCSCPPGLSPLIHAQHLSSPRSQPLS
ncbi:hypothetical protein M407DRAFT_199110 [Tulasnella calospora MUT 4182]|uniref:Uncharacterized protein n=1 Tax=Tulasnella calospora MUT 4182 TaxID=1051891 RepID=A0A0C3MI74_9AGAM|nr:hypothetical protein M407DRAFT_199110 [Tulasnella calospora MUT 4182]